MVERHGTDGFITTKDGLLWRDGKLLNVLEADRVSRSRGFMYAERYVKHLEKEMETNAMIEEVNQQINNIFASNNVTPDGPGEEAFWNAVLDVQRVNVIAAEELRVLGDTWERVQAQAREGLT